MLCKGKKGGKEHQIEANAGEEQGRRESLLQASDWHATTHHIPQDFPCVSSFGYHPRCHSNTTWGLLGKDGYTRENWKKILCDLKVTYSRNPGML